MNQRVVITILGGVLLAVVVASVLVVNVLPENNLETSLPADEFASLEVDPPSGGFDLRVLSRAAYKALDLGPIQSGLLPVKPPTNAGKPNPFL